MHKCAEVHWLKKLQPELQPKKSEHAPIQACHFVSFSAKYVPFLANIIQFDIIISSSDYSVAKEQLLSLRSIDCYNEKLNTWNVGACQIFCHLSECPFVLLRIPLLSCQYIV
jgi:hypothetical protein